MTVVTWRQRCEGAVAYQDHKNALPSCVEEPSPEDPLIKVDVFHSNLVQVWLVQEHIPRVLFVPRREPNDRHRCENHIVRRIELEVVDLRAREKRFPTVKPDWNDQEDVLVEHVGDGVGVSAVVFAPVVEQEVLKEAELCNRVI